ncbi:MAG: Sec-independent protein translocase subunit TatA/TatB [Planctomycetota bacterium]|jgi:sec-independent protein translocase protein TatA
MIATNTEIQLAIPGFQELWPILLIVLILFGGRKLPELARAAGSSITQFKRGLKDDDPERLEDGEPPAAEKEST